MVLMPTQFEVNGMRLYSTDQQEVCWPSVTTVLSKTGGANFEQKMAAWNLANPGKREEAADRGSILHAAVETYVRDLPPQVPLELMEWWDGVERHLNRYDKVVWSEEPLLPEYQHCVAEDGMARVWSHRYGYCGKPDLITVRGGVYILPDLKSSNCPYRRWYPKGPDDRLGFVGHLKYKKCALQLAAYRIAIRETLGIRINTAQILVTTPETTQSFIIHGDELKRYEYRWLQKVRKFWDMVAAGEIELRLKAPEGITEIAVA
jgi:hypothetical protein